MLLIFVGHFFKDMPQGQANLKDLPPGASYAQKNEIKYSIFYLINFYPNSREILPERMKVRPKRNKLQPEFSKGIFIF